ncbi:MAG: glycosyltransferase [Endomicrobiaceae bacterium]|nr:glycosyltransferase [Endomicrobiaceae bacterium]
MNNPKISVIIPVYNGAKYINQCLDSLINQTLTDIEIICVNDGSTDNSPEILQQYSNKDKRIRIINQKNSGSAEARNRGIDISTGDYLSIVDCDDFFDLNMLESLYNHSVKYDTDITLCGARTFDDKTKVVKNINAIKFELLPDKEVFSSNDVEHHILQLCINWCWDKLYKTSFIKRNKIYFHDTQVHNDTFFATYSLIKSERISVLDKILCTYRINVDTSATARSKRMKYPLSFYEALIFLRGHLIKDNTFETFKKSFANFAMDIFYGYYKSVNVNFKCAFIENMGIKGFKRRDFIKFKYYMLYVILSHKPLIILSTVFLPFVIIIKKIIRFR